MKFQTILFLSMFTFGTAFLPTPLSAAQNSTTLTDGWRFICQDVAGAEAANFNDASWEKVTLPHTWNAKDGETSGKYYRGVGWYRLAVSVPKKDAGKRLFIRFGAASTVADVFVNGEKVGEHLGGFSAFCFEITKFVKVGQQNELAVKVSNAWRDDLAPLAGDFTIFGGLYRDVSLIAKNPICISPLDHASSGVKILTNVTDQLAKVSVTTEVANGDLSSKNVTVTTSIYDAAGKMVVSDAKPLHIEAGARHPLAQNLSVQTPHLWNGVADPYLYKVVVTVSDKDGKELDSVTQPLGLRYFKVDPERGFFLNGKSYPLHGVSCHQDRLDKGWAISDADLRQDISLIREMGANAIRAAHYPHADYFYTLCDQAGILVWAEIPQVNTIMNNPQFIGNSRNMLLDLIRQEINHPSIFCWSLSNEIGNGHTENAGPDLTELNQLAHTEDPTRPTTQAASMNGWHVEGMPPINKIPDIIGWNTYPGWYSGKATDMGKVLDQHQNIGKQHGIAVSEYGAGASVLQHEENPPHPKTTGRWHPEEYQAIVHEEDWKAIRSRPWIWGSFVWNMFDFGVAGRNEGDTPGRNDKGLVTYDRKTKKDAFYFYKAQWTTKPAFVYITSRRYAIRNTAAVPVKIYSNCAQIELRVNGVSQGVQTANDEHIFRWENVPLRQGRNVIEATVQGAIPLISDQCEWTYDPLATPMQGPFQPKQKQAKMFTPKP